MAPVRFEGSITDLEIIGTVPDAISGTFYRVMPEPHYPSFIENDPVKKVLCLNASPLLTSCVVVQRRWSRECF